MVNNVEELIVLAGSVEKLAIICNKTANAVIKWRLIGIHEENWPALIKEFRVTPAELYSINQKLRRKRQLKQA